jgi:hypothetical protein
MFSIIFNTVNYLFWFFVWHTFQFVRYIIIHAAPQSFVRKVVTNFMAKEKIKVTMAGDKNIGKYDREKFTCEMVIHNPKFFKRAAADDVMAFGEAYMVSTGIPIVMQTVNATGLRGQRNTSISGGSTFMISLTHSLLFN